MNCFKIWVPLLMSSVLATFPLSAQQRSQRDISAITFLSQVVSAAGGEAKLSSIGDFTASGTITHFWGTRPELGQLTIKSRGPMQFRLDSNLSNGNWSWIGNNGTGKVVLPGYPSVPIYAHNCINSGSLTFPILKVVAALRDQTTSVIDMGTVQFENREVRQIRIQPHLSFDPQGVFSKIMRTDLFFDPATFTLIALQDVRHPDKDAVNNPMVHTVNFANYQNVDGLMVPLAVSELVDGQKTWTIQLSSIEFNVGLTDADFKF
jgi:outer membrane lipoprotein-sorting protein